MSLNPVLQTFVSDVKSILAEYGETEAGVERVAERLKELIATPNATDGIQVPDGNVHTRRQSRPLYTDDTGLTFALARFDSGQFTPIHNHGSWGVVGVYQGRDVLRAYRRLDDGEADGHAKIELIEERILEAGDVAVVPLPPQDIHAQAGAPGETALEFVIFGKNVMEMPRLYFDIEAERAEWNDVRSPDKVADAAS